MKLQPSEQLRAYVQDRIAEITGGAPGEVSEDSSALMVDGGPMYFCWLSADGETFIESTDWSDKTLPTVIDRSKRAQI